MTSETPINDPLMDVVVKVRESRLADFYAIVSDFTKAAEAGGEVQPPQPWTASDTEQAAEVWKRLSKLAHKMFGILVDANGSQVSAQQLVEQLELSEASQVAGALAWPRQHAVAVGRPLPVSTEVTPEGTFYWMETDVAALFRKASR